MCGIAGIIGDCSNSKKILTMMLSRISHRGEDRYQDESIYFPKYAIGTNRLAIVDENNGKQPFSKDNEIFCISNGEIYNHQEIKSKLSKYYHFKSNCDTEVVLMSYLHWGDDFIQYLDGKFAICIIDQSKGKYILARDHIGIKPLYYGYGDNTLFFSSELKSFCDLPSVKIIKALPPGYVMINGKLSSYHETPQYNFCKEEDVILLDKLKSKIIRSIEKRIPIENRKVACLLSGGIDSSIIVYIATTLNVEIEAFTFANQEQYSADLEAARELCHELGVKHTIVSPPESELMEFYLKYGVYLTESYEPVLVRNAVSYHFVCREVRNRQYKFLLNGEGADELFGGYDYFKELPKEYQDNEIRNALLNLHRSYLQMADRASMYATVEARVPYLDKDLIAFSMTLPSHFRINKGIDKWALRELFKDELPKFITQRRKTGMNEGAGFGRNKIEEGIYYRAVKEYYNQRHGSLEKDLRLCLSYSPKFKVDEIDMEEVYNFSRYVENGFIRFNEAHIRLQLNTPLLDNIYYSKNTKIYA